MFEYQLYESSLGTLKNKSSMLDTKLKQYDILSLQLFSNDNVRSMLQASDNKSYDNVQIIKNLNATITNIAFQGQTPDIASIIVSSPVNVYSLLDLEAAFTDYDNRYYRKIKEGEGNLRVLNSDMFTFVQKGSTQAFGIGRLMRDSRLKEMGYFVIFIKDSFFRDVMNNAGFYERSAFYILSKDSSIMYSQVPSHKEGEVFKKILEDKDYRSNDVVVKSISGTPFLITSHTSAYTGWTLINMVPLAYLAKATDFNRNITILFCLLFVLFAIVAAISISSSISSPISSLIHTMRDISRGNLHLRAEISKGLDIKELGTHFNTMLDRINTLILENEKKQRELSNTELAMLQAQINPHFLNNTLNSIRWIALINHQDQIKVLVDNLSKLLINTFKDRDALITLDEELSILQSYVGIMKVRYSNFEINFDIAEGTREMKILRFTLQPFIENSIIHGFSMIDRMGAITISTETSADDLCITVADNGLGMPVQKRLMLEQPHERSANQFSSIGIYNVHKRIQLHYGHGYGITISDNTPSGTVIRILLPIIR